MHVGESTAQQTIGLLATQPFVRHSRVSAFIAVAPLMQVTLWRSTAQNSVAHGLDILALIVRCIAKHVLYRCWLVRTLESLALVVTGALPNMAQMDTLKVVVAAYVVLQKLPTKDFLEESDLRKLGRGLEAIG